MSGAVTLQSTASWSGKESRPVQYTIKRAVFCFACVCVVFSFVFVFSCLLCVCGWLWVFFFGGGGGSGFVSLYLVCLFFLLPPPLPPRQIPQSIRPKCVCVTKAHRHWLSSSSTCTQHWPTTALCRPLHALQAKSIIAQVVACMQARQPISRCMRADRQATHCYQKLYVASLCRYRQWHQFCPLPWLGEFLTGNNKRTAHFIISGQISLRGI